MSSASKPLPSQLTSLYRKHRPRTFEEVIGQEVVVRTLRNAIDQDKVHHAYLFVGSRGTGKTSIAKILAACLNCQQGKSTSPCGRCDSCVSIAAARSLDVIEMDAASNNSVEDIRELRDSVALAPLSGKTKVYILDEAHMLSNAAWNAFLKTLEEPPLRTMFVLATTEVEKVPATVIDRCHRFDFHRPSTEQVAIAVLRAAEAESISLPAEAVALVAKAANGSFRDALGTLEQLFIWGGGGGGTQIELADVRAVLGVVDSQLVRQTLAAVASGDARGILLAIASCIEGGRDVSALASALETRARELLVVGALHEVPKELSLGDEADAQLQEEAESIAAAVIVRLLEFLSAAMQATKAGSDARTQLELALLKAGVPSVDSSTSALLTRIERLEADSYALRGAIPSAEAPSPSAGSAQAPRGAAAKESATASAADEEVKGLGLRGAAKEEGVEARSGGETKATKDGRTDEDGASAFADRPRTDEDGAIAAADHGAAEASDKAKKADDGTGDASDKAKKADDGAEKANGATEGANAEEGRPPRARGGGADSSDTLTSHEQWRELWPAVVDLVRSRNALLGAVIEDARPLRIADGELTVAFASGASFNKKKAEDRDNKAAVAEAVRQLTGASLSLSYSLLDEDPMPEAEPLSEEEMLAILIAEFDAEELPDGPATEGPQQIESE